MFVRVATRDLPCFVLSLYVILDGRHRMQLYLEPRN